MVPRVWSGDAHLSWRVLEREYELPAVNGVSGVLSLPFLSPPSRAYCRVAFPHEYGQSHVTVTQIFSVLIVSCLTLETSLALPNYDTMQAPIAIVMQQQISLFNWLRSPARQCSVHLFIIAKSIHKFHPSISEYLNPCRKVFRGPGRRCYKPLCWLAPQRLWLTRVEPAAAAPNGSPFILLHLVRLRSLRRRSHLLVRQWEYSHVRWLLRPQ